MKNKNFWIGSLVGAVVALGVEYGVRNYGKLKAACHNAYSETLSKLNKGKDGDKESKEDKTASEETEKK